LKNIDIKKIFWDENEYEIIKLSLKNYYWVSNSNKHTLTLGFI
jgi:hypothetical protein